MGTEMQETPRAADGWVHAKHSLHNITNRGPMRGVLEARNVHDEHTIGVFVIASNGREMTITALAKRTAGITNYQELTLETLASSTNCGPEQVREFSQCFWTFGLRWCAMI